MTEKFVVVGGDAAGMSAASKAKRERPELEVTVFERGDWVSYAACGLPYYVKGEVEALDDLVAVTPEEFVEDRDIDLNLRHEVTGIDPEARTCAVVSGEDEFEQSYDRLLVATGAHAVRPGIDGIDLDGIHTIHSMDDGSAIRDGVTDVLEAAAAPDDEPLTVGVVGGGYVGVEMAEAFAGRGASVELFEMLPHVLEPFGEATAEVVEAQLREQGVTLHLETRVEGFAGDDRVEAVDTDDGRIPVDLVVVGVGVAPTTELAADTGIELGPTGAIAVDAYGRTSQEHVFAAGDCAEAHHVLTGEPVHVPLALTANRAGRAIGATVAGDPTPVGEIAGTAIVKAFELEAARTGFIDPAAAREAGFDPVSTTISAPSRAHYYPGARELTVTLVADRPSGLVLGASIVGPDRAGKRIDTVATALHAGMTVAELEYLDLAYAPPFGPVWDPVLTAARVLGGRLEG